MSGVGGAAVARGQRELERLEGEEPDMRRTDSRCLASWMAREQEVVVLPTPPLPPTKIHLRLSAAGGGELSADKVGAGEKRAHLGLGCSAGKAGGPLPLARRKCTAPKTWLKEGKSAVDV